MAKYVTAFVLYPGGGVLKKSVNAGEAGELDAVEHTAKMRAIHEITGGQWGVAMPEYHAWPYMVKAGFKLHSFETDATSLPEAQP